MLVERHRLIYPVPKHRMQRYGGKAPRIVKLANACK